MPICIECTDVALPEPFNGEFYCNECVQFIGRPYCVECADPATHGPDPNDPGVYYCSACVDEVVEFGLQDLPRVYEDAPPPDNNWGPDKARWAPS